MPLKQHFNRQYLKDKIGEENIFTHYFGAWDFGTGYNSVFRPDQKSSTGFYKSKTGSIIYNDLRTGDKYDFVHFVMKKYGLNYYQALTQIATDFGLISGKPSSNKVAVIKPVEQLKKAFKKAFIINTIPYQKQHLDWWAKYYIDSNDLKNNCIYAVDTFIYNKFDENDRLVKTFTSPQNNELKFVYSFVDEAGRSYVKIYTPESEFKWVGDVPLKIPFGLNGLSHDNFNKLIITKSVKDCLVLRKFFPNVIAVQNESTAAFDENLLLLCSKYDEVYVWFDCDRPGLRAANQYRWLYGFTPIFIRYTKKGIWQDILQSKAKGVKDPSDFVSHHGLDAFAQYLKYIKLI